MKMKSVRSLLFACRKKDRTTDLVVKAIRSGFRAIDTACQKKHYEEALVGKALAIVKEKGFDPLGADKVASHA